MMRKQLLLSSLALAMTAGAGHAVASVDCSTPLAAYFSASQSTGVPATAAQRINQCDEPAASVVTAAIKLHPEQAIQITLAAIDAAPNEINEIIAAAVEAAPDQAEEIVASVTEHQPTAAGPAAGNGPAFSPGNMPRGGSGGGSGGGITASAS